MSIHEQGAPPRPKQPGGIKDFGRARNFKAGFLAKLFMMGLLNAFGLYGLFSAYAVAQWGIFAGLVIGLIAANWAYFSKKAIPAKYLYPGLVFLFVYQLFTMAYTGYVAFTNYGDGHNSTKSDAIESILAYNEERVAGSPAFPLTVLEDDSKNLLFAVVRDGQAQVGGAEEPLAPVDATVENNKVTAVPGYTVLDFGQIITRQKEVTELRVPLSEDAQDGSLRTQDASAAYVYESVMQYDAAADTMTNEKTAVVYTPDERGNFVADSGEKLTPGWRVVVGFENFTTMFTDSRVSGPFFQIAVWTFAFAFLSVATTFALGLCLALVFNDPRIRGRKFYRAMLILPYAFPGFLSALVWKGMLNERFGFINDVLLGGASIPWLADPWLAKFSVLAVNLWLGFPYMFLICTGTLQAIPADVLEAAKMDGASAWRVLRGVILPLLMISTAPLLISSFAFNFNNFSLIYMLTGGGPNFAGSPLLIGSTDILISMVYSVAFESGVKQYGLASAVSILIFIFVGLISWIGFRRTRSLEEL